MNKIAIIIPCYNVESSVYDVLTHISTATLSKIHEVICIDNKSTDGTIDAICRAAVAHPELGKKLTLIRNAMNFGYGGSQKIAYDYCLQNGIAFFINIHSDKQGKSDEITSRFLHIYESDPSVDFILASRFISTSSLHGYSRVRIAGNYFFNFLTWLLTGIYMSDAGSAIIFCRTSILRDVPYHSFTHFYQFHPQLNLFIYGNERLHRLETELNWTDDERSMRLNLLKYGLDLSRLLFRYMVRRRILGKEPDMIFGGKGKNPDLTYQIQRF